VAIRAVSDAIMLAGNAISLGATSATTTRCSEFLVGTTPADAAHAADALLLAVHWLRVDESPTAMGRTESVPDWAGGGRVSSPETNPDPWLRRQTIAAADH
jgi:hypothetical protein